MLLWWGVQFLFYEASSSFLRILKQPCSLSISSGSAPDYDDGVIHLITSQKLYQRNCTDRVSVYIYDDYFHFLVAQKLQKHLPLSHDTHI